MTKRGSTAAICLLVLSLPAALLVVDADGSMAVDKADTIRLPSDGVEPEGLGETPTAARRPWDCCDLTLCTKSSLPTCRCMDVVDRCAAACESCEPPESDPSGRVCNDWYRGDPGPRCPYGDHHHQSNHQTVEEMTKKARGDNEQQTTAAEEEEAEVTTMEPPERPWECCNATVCTKSFPPTCRCLDVVDRCAPACDRCEPAEVDPSHRVCKDQYFGDPGPTCKSKHDDGPTGGGSPSTLPAAVGGATGLLWAFSSILLFTQT